MGVFKKRQREVIFSCDFLFSPEANSEEKKNRTDGEKEFLDLHQGAEFREDGERERERRERDTGRA